MFEHEPLFKNRGGVVALQPEFLLEVQRYWVDRAATPRRRAKELRMYWELVGKLDKRQIESINVPIP